MLGREVQAAGGRNFKPTDPPRFLSKLAVSLEPPDGSTWGTHFRDSGPLSSLERPTRRELIHLELWAASVLAMPHGCGAQGSQACDEGFEQLGLLAEMARCCGHGSGVTGEMGDPETRTPLRGRQKEV